jgi:hypothetical protein
VDIEPRRPGRDETDVTDTPRPDQTNTRDERRQDERKRAQRPEEELEEGWAS